MSKKRRSMMIDGTEITATNYTRFFIERNTDTEYCQKAGHKSNLIMNLRDMNSDERKKAAVDIIDCELFLADADLAGGEKPDMAAKMASDNLWSAINVAKRYKIDHDPGIKNELLRKAWDARDPWILFGTTMKEENVRKSAECLESFKSWLGSIDDIMVNRRDAIRALYRFPAFEWVIGAHVICRRSETKLISKSYLLDKVETLQSPGAWKGIFDEGSRALFEKTYQKYNR